MNVCILVGQKIKKLRLKAKLSQEELAHDCDLHRTYIGQIERAEKVIGIVNLQIISKALKVNTEDLFRK